ncbi:fluoride efflux transporter FluC [Glutamicibacter sp. HZAU]|uniref:fluoride efflux transporter FluC n=1 Tax=Glutamicibacter sp. HZAU TaxID=2049891 RepID=UPI000FFCA40F|nr:CrcB family protein [Glutamicibacter sp. HZAU]RWZ83381.1 CrcB family protein [Glutamicibacter sp. HZAU]
MTPPPSRSAQNTVPPSSLAPGSLLLVFLGGAAGTAVRQGLGLLLPSAGGFPIAIFAANMLGAFLLGLLLEALSHGGGSEGRHRRLRLLLGTGFMGGFTTYSALATDSMLLFSSSAVLPALAYALPTVICGALATWCGIALAARRAARTAGGAR